MYCLYKLHDHTSTMQLVIEKMLDAWVFTYFTDHLEIRRLYINLFVCAHFKDSALLYQIGRIKKFLAPNFVTISYCSQLLE